MSQYRQFNEGEFPTNNNPSIITGFQILHQSVDLGLRQSQDVRKSSVKAAALVSRQSQMYSQAKEQGIALNETIVKYDAPTNNKQDLLKKAQNKGEEYRNMDEHKIDVIALSQRFETSLTDGLTQDQAQAKNQQYGDNKLTEKKKKPWWIKMLLEMVQPFSILLWIASIMCFVLYGVNTQALGAESNLWLAIILIAIIILTGSITYYRIEKIIIFFLLFNIISII